MVRLLQRLAPVLGVVGLVLLAVALTSLSFAQPRERKCDNQKDDDRDGAIDCLDSDCDTDPVCLGCQVTEDPEITCDDFLDNDCDGLIDGADSDCGGGDTGGNSLARGLYCDNDQFAAGLCGDMLRADFSVLCDNGETWNVFASVQNGPLPPDPHCHDLGLTQADVSGGGRLGQRDAFGDIAAVPEGAELRSFTVQYEGWVDLNATNGTECPNRDFELYAGRPQNLVPVQGIDDTPCVDNLLLAVWMDRLFKKNATRQEVEFHIQMSDDSDAYFRGGGRLVYVNPLYVISHSPTRVTLTTENPDTGFHDVAEVEVYFDQALQGKATIPLTAYYERVFP